MKPHFQPTLLPFLLLLLFGPTNHALSYYDPGAQRWLNRDPLFERGTMVRAAEPMLSFLWNRRPTADTLFVFARNAPVGSVDAFGLRDFTMTPDPDPLAAEIACATEVGLEWETRYYNDVKTGRHTAGITDKWYHCVASCDITRTCGKFGAALVGILRELGNRNDSDTAADRRANLTGRRLACDKSKSCEEACNDAGYRK